MILIPTAVVSILLPLILHFFSTQVRVPEWHQEVKWGKANASALIASILLALGVSGLSLYGNIHWATGMALASATALLTYTLVQTFYTDPVNRKADRGTLMLAWGLALPVSITYYVTHLEYLGWYEFGGWIGAVIIGFFMIYAPGFGASDGRAFALVAATAIPAIGFMGLVYGFILYMVIGVIGVTFIMKRHKIRLIELNKISIPAVPYILLPFAIMTVYAVISTVLL